MPKQSKDDLHEPIGAAADEQAFSTADFAPPADDAGQSSMDAAKLEEAHDRIQTLEEEVLRAKAEAQNAAQRARKDVENAHAYALKGFANDLLTIIDSLEQGLANCPEGNEHTDAIRAGMVMTHDLFLKTLGKYDIEQIDPMGQAFDPELHEAMAMEESKDAKPNTVITVFQKGYSLKGRLIRPARVIVAKG
jgi:molecular chaperone GrpE